MKSQYARWCAVFLILCAIGFLNACGTKGPLVLPDKNTSKGLVH